MHQIALLDHYLALRYTTMASAGPVIQSSQVPSFQNLIPYPRVRQVEKICGMNDDRLPLRTLFGRIGGCVLWVAHAKPG
jgi:hypothetical protein